MYSVIRWGVTGFLSQHWMNEHTVAREKKNDTQRFNIAGKDSGQRMVEINEPDFRVTKVFGWWLHNTHRATALFPPLAKWTRKCAWRDPVLKHFGAHTPTFDKAFAGGVCAPMASFVTLVMVWRGFSTTLRRTQLIQLVDYGMFIVKDESEWNDEPKRE